LFPLNKQLNLAASAGTHAVEIINRLQIDFHIASPPVFASADLLYDCIQGNSTVHAD